MPDGKKNTKNINPMPVNIKNKSDKSIKVIKSGIVKPLAANTKGNTNTIQNVNENNSNKNVKTKSQSPVLGKQENSTSKTKQVLLSVAIAIIFAFFVGYGISTFYESPDYDDYCGEVRPSPILKTDEEIVQTVITFFKNIKLFLSPHIKQYIPSPRIKNNLS